MQTATGTQLTLSPATATVLKNILTEWINERTPTHQYVQTRYSHMSEKFREFKEKTVTERIIRAQMVIEQLEDTV